MSKAQSGGKLNTPQIISKMPSRFQGPRIPITQTHKPPANTSIAGAASFRQYAGFNNKNPAAIRSIAGANGK